MQFNAEQIASLLEGTIEGAATTQVTNIAKIEEARAGDLCFVSNPKYEPFLYETEASVALVRKELVLQHPVRCTLIRVADPYAGFAALMQYIDKLKKGAARKGIEQPAFVAPSASISDSAYVGAFSYVDAGAVIGENALIYPNCYLGKNVRIGKNVVLYAGVKVYDDCIVGDNSILHSGTVVGGDGFGFAPSGKGNYEKIPQMGNVIIEENVEIGANSTIDRATMGSTIIRKGVKLDNLIQVAHNVEIDENTVIAAQTGIAGSTKIGKHCMIGGQVGIVGHLSIADRTNINAQSGVSKSVSEPGTVLNGSPAYDYKSVLKSQAIFRHLPEMQHKIDALEKLVAELKQQAGVK